MSKKLYVGNLSYNTTDEDLKNLFSKYSSDITVSIITDKQTGRSKGFGFVEFEDDSAADNALEMNGQEVDDRALVVNEARPREERPTESVNKLYIGNLSPETSMESLKSAFVQYGNITDAVVITDKETGESKGFGFVEFATVEEAEAALAHNGEMLDGNAITVNMARPKAPRSDRGGFSRGGDRGGFGRRDRY